MYPGGIDTTSECHSKQTILAVSHPQYYLLIFMHLYIYICSRKNCQTKCLNKKLPMNVISDINILQLFFFAKIEISYKTCSRKHILHTWHVLRCLTRWSLTGNFTKNTHYISRSRDDISRQKRMFLANKRSGTTVFMHSCMSIAPQ